MKKLFLFACVALVCSCGTDTDLSSAYAPEPTVDPVETPAGITFSYDNGTYLTVNEAKSSRAGASTKFSVTIPTEIKKEWFCEADDFLIRLNGAYQPISVVEYPEAIPVDTHHDSLGGGHKVITVNATVNLGKRLDVPADDALVSYKKRTVTYNGIDYCVVIKTTTNNGVNSATHEEVFDCYPVNTGYAETVPVDTYHSNKATSKYITVDAPVNLGKPLNVPEDGWNADNYVSYKKTVVTYNGVAYCVVICTTVTAGVVFHDSVYDCYPVDAAVKHGNSISSNAFKVTEENLVVTVYDLENLNPGDEYTYETWLWVKEGVDLTGWQKTITDACAYSAIPEGYEIRYDVYKGVNGGGSTGYIKVSIHVVKK